MAKPKGYAATRRLRRRAKQQGSRGGNTKRDENTAAAGDGNLAASRDAWLVDLASLNYRPSTIEGRRADLRHFLEWAHQRSIDQPGEVTRAILESYRRHLSQLRKSNGKPLGVTTQRHRLGAVKNLFAWLCKQDRLTANPASEVDLPRPEKPLPEEALSERQVQAVLAQPDVNDPLGVRDRALLELLYASGIRRSEAARLEVADLNCERRTLRLRHTKARRDRVVPVGGRALKWLLRYLDEVRPRLEIDARHQALFLTGYGEAFNPDVLGRKVAAYVKRADTGRGGGCHLLRHSCANHLLEGGADIRFIQQLLGHAKLETTAIYTEVNIRQLREVHRRCHPAGGDEEARGQRRRAGRKRQRSMQLRRKHRIRNPLARKAPMKYTAAMTITHQTVLGEDGEPTAAIIPWELFQRINKQLGGTDADEASDEEAEAIAEAESDRAAGNDEAFTDLADLRAEFAK